MHKDTGEGARAHKKHEAAHTHAHLQRTVETPPASPVPSVSLSVLHSRAQTEPQQSRCEISCLCRALSARACLLACTAALASDVRFKTCLLSDESRGSARRSAAASVSEHVTDAEGRKANPRSDLMAISPDLRPLTSEQAG